MFQTDIICQCDHCHFGVTLRVGCNSAGGIIYKDILDALNDRRWAMIRGKTYCPRCKGVF